jgi:hypothetical protein
MRLAADVCGRSLSLPIPTATCMNEASSRSHCLVTVRCERTSAEDGSVQVKRWDGVCMAMH